MAKMCLTLPFCGNANYLIGDLAMLMDRELLDDERLITDSLVTLPKSQPKQNIIRSYLQHLVTLRDVITSTPQPTDDEVVAFFAQILGLGISQKTLALIFGVTNGTLSRWVSGEQPPRDFIRAPITHVMVEIIDYAIARADAPDIEIMMADAKAKTTSPEKPVATPSTDTTTSTRRPTTTRPKAPRTPANG